MKTHRNEFQKLAGEKESEGDPEFKALMAEMQERDDLKRELGDNAGTSGTRTAVPEHSHEPQAETSHEGHTPDQFTKIAKRDGETPTGGISESAQRDTTTTKHDDTHQETPQGRDVSQQRVNPQQGVTSQQGVAPQQGQSLPQRDPSVQEGEILQDHPYLKYYIHDLDTQPSGASQPLGTIPTTQAQGVQYSQPSSQSTQYTPGAQSATSHQYDRPGSQIAHQSSQSDQGAQGSQYASGDRPSDQSGNQYAQQGPGYEREGGHRHHHGHGHGTEIGETSDQRTMGRQSGAAETAQAQAMFANTDGPSDRGAPGPFTGA